MNKRNLISSFITVFIWILGMFFLFILDFENYAAVNIVWSVIMVLANIAFNVVCELRKQKHRRNKSKSSDDYKGFFGDDNK